ncbi:hypothetical protein ACFWWC_21685 [Streptomyces sp. NPDC058642]|uniref:hypothetical protein n=1 Tax=Streptomyces sp. NPDC058642 TaxID=3346572 RepID=UPI00364AB2B2
MAIEVIERPRSGSRSRAARMISSVAILGRPPTRPQARAAARSPSTMRWRAPLNAFRIAFEGCLTPNNN